MNKNGCHQFSNEQLGRRAVLAAVSFGATRHRPVAYCVRRRTTTASASAIALEPLEHKRQRVTAVPTTVSSKCWARFERS